MTTQLDETISVYMALINQSLLRVPCKHFSSQFLQDRKVKILACKKRSLFTKAVSFGMTSLS